MAWRKRVLALLSQPGFEAFQYSSLVLPDFHCSYDDVSFNLTTDGGASIDLSPLSLSFLFSFYF